MSSKYQFIRNGGESIHPTVLLSKLLRITRNYLQVMGARRLISFKNEFMQRGEQANPHSPNSSLVQVVKHQQRLFAVVRAGEAINFFQVHATR